MSYLSMSHVLMHKKSIMMTMTCLGHNVESMSLVGRKKDESMEHDNLLKITLWEEIVLNINHLLPLVSMTLLSNSHGD